MPEAFRELQNQGLRRAFIVTDPGVKAAGHVNRLVDVLRSSGIDSDVFSDILPDPDLSTVRQAVTQMNLHHPDLIIAIGGGSPMAAAKIMRLLYEHPNVSLEELYTRFMDMQKRIIKFPKLGARVKKLVCIPTTSGTGAEMTPFAVIYDKEKNMVYSIADYSLTPDMAIIDSDLVLSMPKEQVANGGFSAIANALESYVSMLATDYTQGLSQRAIDILIKNLVKSVAGDAKAREACHNAASIAAMAFGNAFVGICNSMAHQLTAAFNIPHGIACAFLICQTIKFNAEDAPSKQGTFPQYTRPMAKGHYAEISDSLSLTHPETSQEEKVDKLVERIEELKVSLGFPRSIREYGISEEAFISQVDSMALNAFDDQCTSSNPRYPLVRELRQLMIDSYFGSIRNLDLSTIYDKASRQNSLDLKLN